MSPDQRASRPGLGWLTARFALTSDHLDHLHTAPMFGVLFADPHRLQFDADVSAALLRSVAVVADAIAGILGRGQRERSIRADEPPLTLAWLVVPLILALDGACAREMRKAEQRRNS